MKKDNGTRYHVSVVHFNVYDPEFRMEIYRRVLASFDNLDEAIDKFFDIATKEEPDLKRERWFAENDIREHSDYLFSDQYGIIFENMKDFGEKYYVGPGAYSLTASRLQ